MSPTQLVSLLQSVFPTHYLPSTPKNFILVCKDCIKKYSISSKSFTIYPSVHACVHFFQYAYVCYSYLL